MSKVDPLLGRIRTEDDKHIVESVVREIHRSGSGGVQSVRAGTNVTVDVTDPANPIVSSSGGGGGGTWGSITGTLADQTDLQTALDAKQPLDAQLTDVAGLTPTDNAVIIGNGTNFVAESGATLKTSLGLTIGTDVQAYDADLTTWAGITPGANVGTFLATPSSANLLAAVTNETGTGLLVFNDTPTLVTPTIAATGFSNMNHTHAGASTGGTIAQSALTGFGAGVSTFLATPSSANLLAALTTSTGTGVNTFATSPTFTTDITTPLIYGGSGATDTLTLQASSAGMNVGNTANRIKAVDQIDFFFGDRTITSAIGNFLNFNSNLTMNYASWTLGQIVSANGTITGAVNPNSAGMGTLFSNNLVYTNDPAGTQTIFGALTGFASQAVITASTNALTNSLQRPFLERTRFSTTAGGTLAVTDLNQYTAADGATVGTLGSGVTVTNRRGFHVNDLTLGSGTLTTNVGVEIDALARGVTNNIGLRIAAPTGATNNYAIHLPSAGNATGGGITFRATGSELYWYSGSSSTLDTNGNIQTTSVAASSSTGGSGAIWRHNDGAAMAAGDRLGFNLFSGYDGATMRNSAGFNAYADATWSSGVYATYLNVETSDGSGARVERFRVGGAAGISAVFTAGYVSMNGSRFRQAQGADVASANNLVLGSDGNTFEITGTTQVNLLSNLTWQNGSTVTLMFTSTPTVKHAQATSTTNITILLAGAADFVATAGDNLTLTLSEIGGTQAWRETGRTVI